MIDTDHDTTSQSDSDQDPNNFPSEKDEDSHTSQYEDRAVCPMCGLVNTDSGGLWIGCDGYNEWFDFKCTNIKSKKHVPDILFCEKCQM